MKRMFRYEVPVDGQVHEFELTGFPMHIVAREPDLIEFWAEEYDSNAVRETYYLKVFGTGHPIPESASYLGTTQRINGFVWHLYDVDEEE